MNEHEQLEDLIPAYALGALEPDERAALEARLATDEAAQKLLAEYEQITGALVYAVPAYELPPHLSDDLRQRLVQAKAPAAPKQLLQRPPMQLPARPPWRRYQTLSWLAVAAAIVLVIVGAGLALSPVNQPTPAPSLTIDEQLFADLQTRENSLRLTVVAGEEQQQITGELVAASDGTLAVIEVRDMPTLTEDQTFQLWMRDVDGVVVSGGLFQCGLEHATYIMIPLEDRSLAEFVAFGVSLEPAGGSPYPDRRSGPRVFSVPLPQDS